jgi:hypothetical protein
VKLPPLGLQVNTLPSLYLVNAEDGGVWLVRDHSHTEATGRQQYLAHIPKAVLDFCTEAREAQALRL